VTNKVITDKNKKLAAAIADKPRDAFRGQSSSPNDSICYGFLLVCYSNFVPKTKIFCFWDIRFVSIPWPWNLGYVSLEVIRTDTSRSATDDFLLT